MPDVLGDIVPDVEAKRIKSFSTAGVSCGPSFRQPAAASDV